MTDKHSQADIVQQVRAINAPENIVLDVTEMVRVITDAYWPAMERIRLALEELDRVNPYDHGLLVSEGIQRAVLALDVASPAPASDPYAKLDRIRDVLQEADSDYAGLVGAFGKIQEILNG